LTFVLNINKLTKPHIRIYFLKILIGSRFGFGGELCFSSNFSTIFTFSSFLGVKIGERSSEDGIIYFFFFLVLTF